MTVWLELTSRLAVLRNYASPWEVLPTSARLPYPRTPMNCENTPCTFDRCLFMMCVMCT